MGARHDAPLLPWPFSAPEMKPYSEACENNQAPILEILRRVFVGPGKILEIGSGTGQHAVYFARHLPHLIWQTSDLPEHHAGIRLWLDEAQLANVLPPIPLDVKEKSWPVPAVQGVFTANTLHIISWQEVEDLLHGVAQVLVSNGAFVVYGPFNYDGQFTAPSNARFDAWLKARDPASGVRDAEAVVAYAASQGLQLQADYEMPVNNRSLVFRKETAS